MNLKEITETRAVAGCRSSVIKICFLALITCSAGGRAIGTSNDIFLYRNHGQLNTYNCIKTDLHCSGFNNLIDAVVAASNLYNPLSIQQDREFIGAILQDKNGDGEYLYTVAAGLPGNDRVTTRIQVPRAYELVAFWHTHGAAHWTREYFSKIDTDLVRNSHLPFFMSNHVGELLVFKPGSPTLSKSRAVRLGLGRQRGYARGAKIINQATGRAVAIATF